MQQTFLDRATKNRIPRKPHPCPGRWRRGSCRAAVLRPAPDRPPPPAPLADRHPPPARSPAASGPRCTRRPAASRPPPTPQMQGRDCCGFDLPAGGRIFLAACHPCAPKWCAKVVTSSSVWREREPQTHKNSLQLQANRSDLRPEHTFRRRTRCARMRRRRAAAMAAPSCSRRKATVCSCAAAASAAASAATTSIALHHTQDYMPSCS